MKLQNHLSRTNMIYLLITKNGKNYNVLIEKKPHLMLDFMVQTTTRK